VEPTHGKKLEIWLPVPKSSNVQEISNLQIISEDLAYTLKDEPIHGNRYLYVFSKMGITNPTTITMTFDVHRKEHSNISDKNADPNNYLGSYSNVPTGNIFSKIINENDFINIEELCFGDNDKLSAMVANKVSADLLVLMSNIDGLYSNYNLEEVVTYVSKLDEVRQYVLKKKSLDGTGGMDSKFRAAEIFNGITMIVNGQKTGNLEKVLCGEEIGTLFDLK